MNSVDAGSSSRSNAGHAFVVICLAILIAGRLAFHLLAAPLPDEAYYWLWGQRLSLSYYDHPPLHAWLHAPATALFGNTNFGLRAPALLTTVWLVLLLGWWVRRAARLGMRVSLTTAVAVFFASPIIFIYTAIVFPDHLMLALVGTAAAAFTTALHDVARTGRVNAAALYLAGLATGLATLSKYNGALFGIGAALAIVAVPRFRPLLRSPHLYLAGIVALACMAPVAVWNLQNGSASFQYHLVDRLGLRFSLPRIAEHAITFLLTSAVLLSPFLVVALVRFFRDRSGAPWQEGWRPLAVATLAASTLVFLALTPLVFVVFHWNIVAYQAFLPYAVHYMGRWLIAAHLALGVLCAVLYPFNYVVLPLAALLGGNDTEAAMAYGWDDVAQRVKQEQQAHDADFLLASYYMIGATLAFHTGDTSVEVISADRSHFDFWFDETARERQDALILTDDWHPLRDLHRKRFQSIEPVAELPVVRFGRTLKVYRLHVGRGYIPR